jgi:CDGSH-type Zn-finger protein
MKKETNSSIKATENGPYIAVDISNFKTSKCDCIKTSKIMSLCRCGHSKNKPFCDGTHIKVNFNSEKLDGRQPDRVDDYVGRGITIHDNRGVCSHIGFCTDNLPAVFIIGKEPWIDPNGAPVEEIIRVIKMCPSGALSYSLDGVKHDALDREAGVSLRRDGPYHVVGGIKLDDYNKSKPQSNEHYTLCRCGGSKNKPFCDGNHWYIKFKHNESNILVEKCKENKVED